MIDDYLGWHLDFTGPLMVMTLKLIAFSYNVHDGRVLKKVCATRVPLCAGRCTVTDPPKSQKDGASKPSAAEDRQRKMSVDAVPDLLSFAAYTFYYGGILIGPFFEFVPFRDFIEKNDRKLRPPWRRVAETFAYAAFFAIVNSTLTPKFNADLWRTADFEQLNVVYKCAAADVIDLRRPRRPLIYMH